MKPIEAEVATVTVSGGLFIRRGALALLRISFAQFSFSPSAPYVGGATPVLLPITLPFFRALPLLGASHPACACLF